MFPCFMLYMHFWEMVHNLNSHKGNPLYNVTNRDTFQDLDCTYSQMHFYHFYKTILVLTNSRQYTQAQGTIIMAMVSTATRIADNECGAQIHTGDYVLVHITPTVHRTKQLTAGFHHTNHIRVNLPCI